MLMCLLFGTIVMIILFELSVVPVISLDQRDYEELENNTLTVHLLRTGDFVLPLTVYLTAVPVSGDNAATGM